jgi:hypothetical protein
MSRQPAPRDAESLAQLRAAKHEALYRLIHWDPQAFLNTSEADLIAVLLAEATFEPPALLRTAPTWKTRRKTPSATGLKSLTAR